MGVQHPKRNCKKNFKKYLVILKIGLSLSSKSITIKPFIMKIDTIIIHSEFPCKLVTSEGVHIEINYSLALELIREKQCKMMSDRFGFKYYYFD